MKLSELIKRIRFQVPNMDTTAYTDTDLMELLNQACNKTNLLVKVYKGYTDFNIEADKRVYSLGVIAPKFLGPDKRGLYFLNDNDKYDQPTSKTEEWIAKHYPGYLNAESVGVPTYYWTEGDELGFYPPPSTAYALGCRIYHLQKATEMSSDEHYPFIGSTTEISSFIALDDALIAYCRWKMVPSFGKVTDQDLRYREYLGECKKGARFIKRRPDIANSVDYGIIG